MYTLTRHVAFKKIIWTKKYLHFCFCMIHAIYPLNTSSCLHFPVLCENETACTTLNFICNIPSHGYILLRFP